MDGDSPELLNTSLIWGSNLIFICNNFGADGILGTARGALPGNVDLYFLVFVSAKPAHKWANGNLNTDKKTKEIKTSTCRNQHVAEGLGELCLKQYEGIRATIDEQNRFRMLHCDCDPAPPLPESPGPSGLGIKKKESPGAFRPRGPKHVRNVSETVSKQSPESQNRLS